MTNPEENSEDTGGAVCPFCGKRNIVYEGLTCPHYGCYNNIDAGYWEFDDGSEIMKKVGKKITAEFATLEKRLEELEDVLSKKPSANSARLKKEQKKLQKIVREDECGDGERAFLLGKYQSKRLKEIITKAKYEYAGECFATVCFIPMIFIDKAGQDQANKYLKSK